MRLSIDGISGGLVNPTYAPPRLKILLWRGILGLPRLANYNDCNIFIVCE
jgi:hypothetical protein